jgi:hypothetical protein
MNEKLSACMVKLVFQITHSLRTATPATASGSDQSAGLDERRIGWIELQLDVAHEAAARHPSALSPVSVKTEPVPPIVKSRPAAAGPVETS